MCGSLHSQNVLEFFPHYSLYYACSNVLKCFPYAFIIIFSNSVTFIIFVPYVGIHAFRRPTRCSSKQSLFILLPSHSTCFVCLPHPSSGVHRLQLQPLVRGELIYLAPLGSENISAPYFKQYFFRGGILPPRLSQTPRLPVPRQK